MKNSLINYYLFTQILKNFFLILFIFLSVAWILQITRLFTVTNFIHVEILEILFLSLYLIPNIITIILPFIIIFGLLLCFVKLKKDNELISILSLGFGLRPFKITILLFSIVIIITFIFLSLYISPKIYEQYKIKELEMRNKLDFNNIKVSNFLNLDNSTILDFKKGRDEYFDIMISYTDSKENLIYAKRGNIINENDQYRFELINGFKISIDNKEQVEKLEFLNYILKIDNKNILNNEINDNNTYTIFDDLDSKNYINIIFKITDFIILIYIIFLFYTNHLKDINFNTSNNIYYSLSCIFVLITNQILKNSNITINKYTISILSIIIISLTLTYFKKKYE